jgi:hypothetical protein
MIGYYAGSRKSNKKIWIAIKSRDRTAKTGGCMPKVDEIKSAIESLPEEEFVELREWFSEKDWERWDKQIEIDSNSGKLDFLVEEAFEEKRRGKLKDL